jgi:hypothetical protein
MKPWECAIGCPQLSVLRDDCLGRQFPYPSDSSIEPLFPNSPAFHDHERARDIAMHHAANTPIELDFTVIRDIDTSRATIILRLPQPETAIYAFKDHRKAFELDLGQALLSDVGLGKADILWSGCKAHGAASAKKENKAELSVKAQRGTRVDSQVRYFTEQALPLEYRKLARHVKARAVVEGTPGSAHPNDLIARMKVACAL